MSWFWQDQNNSYNPKIDCFITYLITKGGRLGYVTPLTKPCKTLSTKTSHMLFFDTTGISNVKIEQNNVVPPNIRLVPIFSAKVPPKIWNTMYP